MRRGVRWHGKLRRRFGLLAALVLVAAVAAAVAVARLRARAEEAVRVADAPLEALREAERHALETALAVQTLRAVLPGSVPPYVQQEIVEHWRATRESWRTAQRARSDLVARTGWPWPDGADAVPDETDRIAEVAAALDDFEAAVRQLLASPTPPAAERLWTDAQALLLRFEALRDAWAPAAVAVRERMAHRLNELPWILAAGGVGLAALALVFGALLASGLEARADSLARAAQSWAAGAPVPFDDRPGDEFAPLAQALNAVQTEQAAREQTLRAELERARSEAERAREAAATTNVFVSEVSHELRIPLTSILGFAELLAQDWEWLADEDRRRYVDIVERNARHLLHVVSDLLNLAKAEAGVLEVTLGAVEVREVVEAAVATLGPRAVSRGVRVAVRADGPTVARADWGRLRQVVLNLLDNAIKYSPPDGQVEVRIHGSPDRVRLEVADQGPGIAPELQDRLFRPFSRLHPGGRRLPGAGLGLALVKRLVDLMGGRVGVHSAPGQGSCFWVELDSGLGLPAAPRPDREEPVPATAHPGTPVAVVDDDPDLRAFAVQVLRQAGFRVLADGAEDPAATVGRLAQAQPRVVLLDLRLGDRQGAELLAALRAQPALASVPVLAFTAALADNERQALLRQGFDGLLPKPIAPAALVRALDAVLRSCPVRRPPAPTPADGRTAAPDDALAAVRAKFVAGLADRAAALRTAAAQDDRSTLARELHKLKGAAASFGERALAEAAASAEAALKDDRGDWRVALERAFAEIERVRQQTPTHPSS